MKFANSVFVAAIALFVACSPTPEPSSNGADDTRRPVTAEGRTLVTVRGPAGAVIALEPLFEHAFPPPAGPAYMDQSCQMFIPGLLTARTGQPVEFRSSEDVLHNVRVDHGPARTPVFNVATPPFGKYVHTFTESGFYNVSCDIHTVMRATLFLSDAPYVGEIPDTGSIEFRDVVQGSYRVTGFVEGNPIDKKFQASGGETTLQLP